MKKEATKGSASRFRSDVALFFLCALCVGIASADSLEFRECGRASARHNMGATSFDPVDGRDRREYPPDVAVDFIHLRLEMTFTDLRSKSFDAKASLTFRPVRDDLALLKLDAVDLFIERVTDESERDLRFDYDAEQLTVFFKEPPPTDADTTLTVHYRCVDPREGMIFALPDAAYPDRPLVIHTQGETETSRYWYPCLDYPADRLTTEIEVTVPQPYFALSNGRLVGVKSDDGNQWTTYHWKQGVPHVFYLVTLVIGEFDVVEDQWRDVPIQYYVPKGQAALAARTYARTPAMIEFFSKLVGVDYPYEKYAQVNVPLFMFGGMENTTATTMHDRALLDKRAALDNDEDGLISHELAHQWYGDLITCRSWPHVWLNEGFATFFATAWRGEQFGRAEYLHEFWTRYQAVVEADRTDIPGALVYTDFSDSFEPFFHKGSLAYSKGSCVLQMLRHQLGEQVFWKAIQTYTRRFRETQVETDDLRHVFEETSGRGLERFFEQWVYRPGVPHVEVGYEWDAETNTVEVSITQTQHIDDKTPAFSFPIDLYFRAGGETVTATVNVSSRTDSYRRRFDVKPDMFCVDPNAGLLMKRTCRKPRPMWLTQLADGPTVVAKMEAARNLGKFDRPEVVEALSHELNNSSLHWTVRSEVARALGKMQAPKAMDALIRAIEQWPAATDPATRSASHKSRRAAVEALGAYRDRRAVQTLLPIARSDASYSVEAAATTALANSHAGESDDEVVSVLLKNVHKNSYHDTIRIAALNALARLNAREGIVVAKQYASYGHHERTREVAIRALGRLGRREKDREDVREFVIGFLDDPQPWSRWGAIDALADIGDARARDAIDKLLAGAIRPRTRRTAEEALKRIKTAAGQSPIVESLQTEVDVLRRHIRRLEKRVRRVESLDRSAEVGGR